MVSNYDYNNIFAKILRGDLPSSPLLSNDFVLCLNDIKPQAPVHILILPKQSYVCFDDFLDRASEVEIIAYYRAINEMIELKNLKTTGYRLISNAGRDGMQTIPHFHTHLLGGGELGINLLAK